MRDKEIDQKNLDTAIALGDAVCNELGICCGKRGQVIFQIYKKLEELKPREEAAQQSKKIQDEVRELSESIATKSEAKGQPVQG